MFVIDERRKRFLKTLSVMALAEALFSKFGWDVDRAVATAYWFKFDKMVGQNLERYLAHRSRLRSVPIISADEETWLLDAYDRFKRGLG